MATSTDPTALARQLLTILSGDLPRLDRIDRYLAGKHADPYMPQNANSEYKLLAKRAVSNWMPLVVNTPAQALYVDSFRPSRAGATEAKDSPEWKHWQFSRMDARQTAVHRGALSYGHSFTVTEMDAKGKVVTRGLSPMRTAALYVDPANDCAPYAALTVVDWNDENGHVGEAILWTATEKFIVFFKAIDDLESVVVGDGAAHGSSECPVTRFAAAIDLEGRTLGVVEPMMALQDRINQTIFDLLIAQTYASTKVRYVTGMAPPVKRDEDGEPVLDRDGNPTPLPINHNAARFLFAEDSEVKFGSLDESPLGGFIESIDMSIRHLAAKAQLPPHHLLGQIANLSADALLAAETSLARMVSEIRVMFGESWERCFRLAGELSGDTGSAEDFGGEVIWRDMEQRSLAQAADALGKLAQQLGIPLRGLWPRVPGVTKNELDSWDELKETEDPIAMLGNTLQRATNPTTPPAAPAAA